MGQRRRSKCAVARATAMLAALFATAPLAGGFAEARAEQSSFHVYGAEPGQSELSGQCIIEDRAGFLYICTDHGLFSFDGRQFTALGADQGLPSAHEVDGLAISSSGRLIVRYDSEIRIADEPGSARLPPATLHFRALQAEISPAHSPRSLANWHGGVALIDGASLRMITVPAGGSATMQDLVLPAAIRPTAETRIKGLFSIGENLWLPRSDGRICVWSKAPRCFGAEDGLPGDQWAAVAKAPDGSILARSPHLVATLAPGRTTWTVDRLPDQDGAYDNYLDKLSLFHTPDGNVITQTAHGLAVLRDHRWQVVTVNQGAPIGLITSSLVDRSGSLWLQSFGKGILRWVGYGGWQTLTHLDGLSSGMAWELARTADHSVWAATDTGIDEIVPTDGRLAIGKRVPGAGYALGSSAGLLWGSDGQVGSRVIDPSDATERKLAIPAALAVVPGGAATTWLGTTDGIFRCDGNRIQDVTCARITTGMTRDMIADGAGGLYYIRGHALRRRAADGTDTLVVGRWPAGGFAPYAVARGPENSIWVGGDGGLFRVWLRGSAPVLIETVPQSDLETSTIAAVLVDRRGWLWAGTKVGLSVFDGRRWVSLNTEDGLLSNDINERGLREDPDGTLWISSSEGVSHVLHPERVFAPKKLEVVISRALLDGQMIRGTDLPFNRKPLLIDVGTPAYSAEQSVTFRYRMSGVDDDWIETNSGRIFYPFVPPGRHKFEVFAYDLLKHRVSEPQTLTIDIDYPWWRRWWSETLWSLAVIGALYGLFRLRVRAERARQAELERRVEEVTAEIRQAQAALAYQATHDQLTGLLNRSAVESRLAGFLRDTSDLPGVVIGLVDIDHFKAINDGWGHLTGDSVLREMGALSAGMLRSDEFAGRYGGEEILVVLRNGDGRAVSRLAEFHQRVRTHSFSKAGTPGILNVTCSIGLAAVFGGDNWETLIGRADRALYHAKRSGRDRIAGLAGSTGSHDAETMHERARSGDAP